MRLGLKRRPRPRSSRMKAVVAVLGMMVVLTSVSVLVIESLKGGEQALLSARVLDTAFTEEARQLRVQIDNKGGRTASEVTVAVATSGETVRALIDYVPARGSRDVFVHVPAEGEVQITVESWVDP